MSRTTFIVKCSDANQAAQVAERILISEKYDRILENGETVWKCGNGLWAAIRYIKLEFPDPNTMHISGWVKATIGGEMNLDGTYGGLPKKQVSKVIKQIQTAIL